MTAALQKYVISYLLKYGGQLLLDLIQHWKRSSEQRNALNEAEKVAKNPNSSALEIGEAYAKAVNAGRS